VQRTPPPNQLPNASAGAVPWRAQPRPSVGATPPSAFQPPRMIGPAEAPRGSVAPPPPAVQSSGAPKAVPRAGAPSGGTPRAAPAQPAPRSAPAPAGARSPRSR
jgi:hypothetical protein